MNVPLWSRIISGIIGIFITVAGALVTVILWNDHRMDEKDNVVKSDLIQIMDSRKLTRDTEISGIQGNFQSELGGVKTQLASMDSKLNILIGLGRKSRVMVDLKPTDLYTKRKTEDSEIEGSL